MSYLKHKPGSIEELMANEASKLNDNAYQDMFKKELEKAGKGIGAMTPAEKKAFFNKIDDKYKAKNEDIKEGRYEVTGTVTYQGVSGEDEVTVVVDAMDKMDAEDVADDMIDDLRSKKKIGPKRGGQVKAFYPFDVEYTRKKEGLVDKMMEKVDEPYAVGMAQAMKSTGDKPPLKKSTITKAHDIAKSIEKDDKKEEVEESAASDKAKAMGLTYLHFGRYGKDGKVTHKNIGGNLTRVGKDEKPIKSSDKASKDQPNKSSKVTSDVVDIEPRELKKQAKKYGLTVKIGSGDSDDGYEVEFKGPQKNLVKYYKNHMGYDGKDFKGLGGLGDISENYPHKMYSKDGKEVEAKTPEDHKKYADMGYTHKNETHSFMTKDMNKSKKDAKGEKEIVDPEPKMKQESIQDAIANVWKMSAEELEKIKTEAKYMKAQRMSQYRAEKDEKNKKGTADTGSKMTPVDVEPKVDYKN
jgi:hypothetical protein